jgi:simple sugar transport system ATP-binding protein
VANRAVDLAVAEGEIHTLLGENGAGKTTLMKVLYGHFPPDDGEVHIDGERQRFRSPRDAIDAGIGMVHQHFMLVDTMTITENIFLGEETTGAFNIFVEDERETVRDLSQKYGFDIDPDAYIEDVSVGVQQRVEILKTLSRGADVIILDEPTAVLTPQEVEELFGILRRLREEGKTIILITHKLNEALTISDKITVLRDGERIDTVAPAETSKPELAEMMVGRKVMLDIEKTDHSVGDRVLAVDDLRLSNAENVDSISDISFDVQEGEIFGVAGVDGNGQTELAELIAGLRTPDAGTIEFLDRDVTDTPRRERIDAGMAYIPEDRETTGLVMDLDLVYNGVLGSQFSPAFSTQIRILWDRVRSHVEDVIDTYDVRPGDPTETADSLSGGNKQKFIVGRELERDPSLLIASHPTRGVDVGSIEFIRERLLEIRDDDKAILLLSSKLDEAMQLSDRLAVMYEGEFIDVVDPETSTEEEVGLLMAGESPADRTAPRTQPTR